jgi:chromosome partitioning protein
VTGSYQVVVERKSIRGTIIPTSVPGMDVVPSTIDLSGAEIELVDLPEREYRLREALPHTACARPCRRSCRFTTTSSSTARRRSGCSP